MGLVNGSTCGAMRQFRAETVECDRPRGHKSRKHRARWREGRGARFVDVVVRWKSRKS